VFSRHNLFKDELRRVFMKIMTFVFAGMFLLALGFVSAESYVYEDEDVVCVVGDDDVSCEYVEAESGTFSTSCTDCYPVKTIVKGMVFDEASGVGIIGANVEIICDHDGALTTMYTQSLFGGFYVVKFDDADCTLGDFVTVNAEKDGLVGTGGPKEIKDKILDCWNVVCICVPMVPEFGFVIGMLTALSAVGIFFVVRKE
jgi:hypothetical protein